MTSTGITPTKAIEPRRGAAVLLEVLRSEGVRYVFGNPGTTEMPLIDALTGMPEISYILGLQEACVVGMAHGYALASGRPGFVNLHTAGGLGNGMGALINAQIANTPLVITAGQQDTRHNFMDPVLGGDLVGIAGPVVKWTHEVLHPEHLPVMVRRALHDSAAAPCGPVFLSLPIDVMERMTDTSIGEVSRIDRASVAGSLDELADALATVAPGRLALIAGDEVFSSYAGDEMVALAEALGAPVFGSSWPAHIPFPTAHPLWSGSLATKASEIRQQLHSFDAIFAIGGHSAITYLYTDGPALPAGCRLYQLSPNVRDLGRIYSATLACAGEIRVSLQALIPGLERKLRPHQNAILALRERATLERVALQAELAARSAAECNAPVTTPLTAAAEIVRAIGPDVAIVDEAPAIMPSVRQFLNSSSARQYYWTRGAILGWGMPAAIGVSLGLDRQPVVSLVGDGAALYSPQALWTAAHERLPITFIVSNNGEYNVLKNYMKGQPHYLSARENRFIGMELTNPAIDFVALAAAMGVPARRIDRAADIAAAVEDGIASGLPNLIEVPICAT